MFRFLFRILGLVAVAVGLVGIVVDGAKSIAAHALVVTPLGEAWAMLAPQSLQAIEDASTTNGIGFLWDPVLVSILALPNWLVLTVVGYLLIAATAPRRRTMRHIRL